MRKKFNGNLWFVLLVAFFVAWGGLSPARAYSLDVEFDGDGKVLTDFGDPDAFIGISTLLQQGDGKIVAVGIAGTYHFALMRFNQDGTLDRSFGGDGKVVLNITEYDSYPTATIDGNGKIIIAGRGGYPYSTGESLLVVARVNSDGTLDRSFHQKGWSQFVTPQASPYLPLSVAADKDHRILVAGNTAFFGAQGFVLRFAANGDLDASFDGDGLLLPALSSSNFDACVGVTADDQNRVLLVGSALNSLVTARFQTDGAFDTSFGGTGFVRENNFSVIGNYIGETATRIKVLADGRIVTTGAYYDSFVQTRYLPNGTRDTTLVRNGYATIKLGASEGPRFYVNFIAPDGTVTVAAATQESPSGEATQFGVRLARFTPSGALDANFRGQLFLPLKNQYVLSTLLCPADGGVVFHATSGLYPDTQLFILRLNAQGKPDTSWSGGTIVSGENSEDSIEDTALDAKGRLIAAGSKIGYKTRGSGVARYLPDGQLDASFGQNGKVILGERNEYFHRLLCYPDGRILVAASEYGQERRLVLRRLLENGSPDDTFGSGGQASLAYGGDYTCGLARASDGKIGVGLGNGLMRLLDDGRVDTTFGDRTVLPGFLFVSGLRSCSGMAQDRLGRLILVGRSDYGNIGVARCFAHGALDSSFDGDGFKEIDLGNAYDLAYALALAPDGKILLGGYTEPANSSTRASSRLGTRARNANAALVRLHQNGSLDQNFDQDGILLLPTTMARYFTDLVVEKSGDIWGAAYRTADFGLVRVRANGTLDSSLGSDGVLDIDLGGNDYSTSILLDSEERVVLAGYSDVNGTKDFALARIGLEHLTISDAQLIEGHDSYKMARFAVRLSPASPLPVSVNYLTTNGTAQSGTAPGGDYSAVEGNLNFAPGETTKVIEVPISGDKLDESDEFFRVNLSLPINARIERGQALGTIVNDDRPPAATINDVTVKEGNSGFVNATFLINLSAPSGQTVTLDAMSYNGSARTPHDYTSSSVRLVFRPGETRKTLSLPVQGDLLKESDETFFVVLSAPVNCSLGRGRGTATILNDDSAPALTINDVSISEGNSATKLLTFTVTLSKASGQTVTVNYATADGVARSGSDYSAQNGTLTFVPGGALSKTISIVINGDSLVEGNETFFVLLSGATNASVSKARGVGTITNDDTSG
jgi:uncharacterized delta-60 repeat protein